MPKVVNAHDTLLKRGNGATPEVFETVAKVISDISGPGITRGTHQIRGRGEKWARKLPGKPDAGQLSFTIAFMPQSPTHAALLADAHSEEIRNWQIAFPDPEATVWQVAGFVSSFELNEPEDGTLTAAVTIELDGEPNFDA